MRGRGREKERKRGCVTEKNNKREVQGVSR